MPSLKQGVILQIVGNLKAFLKLEMGITRGRVAGVRERLCSRASWASSVEDSQKQKRQINQPRGGGGA